MGMVSGQVPDQQSSRPILILWNLSIYVSMQALWAVLNRKKGMLFYWATYIVAILFCHYIFCHFDLKGSKRSYELACHYKKTTGFHTEKIIFFSIKNHLVGMQMADEFFIQNSSARTQKAQSEDCAFVMKPQWLRAVKIFIMHAQQV